MRALVFLLFIVSPAWAVTCNEIQFEGDAYSVCKVDADQDIRLFLNDPETGTIFGSFRGVKRSLDDGETLLFAMNAGMYHPDRRPVGHYRENGVSQTPVLKNASPGNFGLLPNGVFCLTDGAAHVIETLRFDAKPRDCVYATQSGPMLVIEGDLHPRFIPDSDSRFIRNGVGSSADGQTVWFAISERPVNFHTFGRLFRDHLQTPNALYFDGKISKLYAPDLNRADGGFPMGPIVGVVE